MPDLDGGEIGDLCAFQPARQHCVGRVRPAENESVQNIRLLSGNAPEAYAELLAYDCRLMNVPTSKNQALVLRDWLTQSDEWLSPQAAVLSPAAACRIAEKIVHGGTHYSRTVAAGQEASGILREGIDSGRLTLSVRNCDGSIASTWNWPAFRRMRTPYSMR